MPKGRKKNYKGAHKKFTNVEQLEEDLEKQRKEKEWRSKKGIESDEEEGEDADKKETTKAEASAPSAQSSDKGLPPSESEESSEEDSDDESSKAKGVQHLIEVENPNRMKPIRKKPDAPATHGAGGGSETGGAGGGAHLTRKEREEIEKQQAKANYMKMHMAGKTDEARSDLARLALIKKQREDAAKKRDEEKKAREAAAKKGKS